MKAARLFPLIVLMLSFSASGSALARRAPPVIYDMVLGQAVRPPFGYQDFCRREPADCFAPEPRDGEASRRAAGPAFLADAEFVHRSGAGADGSPEANFWAFAFRSGEARSRAAYRGREILAAPPAAIRPVSRPLSLKRGLGRKPLSGLLSFPPEVDAHGRIVMTRDVASELNRINRDVNRRVIAVSDKANYGELDVWALPLSRNARRWGDCEDFAVEKRHQLMQAGYPLRLLSIALVRTRWGDTHALLLVETDKGAFALDSFSTWIVPWWKLDYHWIMRQSVRDPGVWVSVLGEGWSGGAATAPG